MEAKTTVQEIKNITPQAAIGAIILYLTKQSATEFQGSLDTPMGKLTLHCILTVDGEEFEFDNQDD